MAGRKLVDWAGGIRVRLVALALIATAPFIWTRIAEIHSVESEITTSIREDAVDAAAHGAGEQGQLFAEVRTLLMALSKVPMVTYGSTADCGRFLVSVVKTAIWAKNLAVMTPAGDVFCSTDPKAVGLKLGDRDYFREAVRTRGLVVGNYVTSRLDGNPILPAVFPVFTPGGSLVSVVMATLNVSWLDTMAADLGAKIGARVYLLDAAGAVVARFPATGLAAAPQSEDAGLAIAAGRQTGGWFEYAEAGGATRVYGIAELPGTHARLAIGYSLDAALADTRSKMQQAYFNAVLTGVIVVLLAWLFAEVYVVAPLRGLLDTTRRLTHGELDARAELKNAPQEFRELGTSFNTMADQLSTMATVDSLTGVANRRRCDQYIEDEWQRGLRSRQPLAVALIDVDRFKDFNDLNGHQAGDESLRLVAGGLRRMIRRHGDFIGRFGGDEFVLCLPGVEGPEARDFCEKLRAKVEELAISSAREKFRTVTITIGVAAAVPSAQSSVKQLIARADRALYEAKRRGRNQVALDGAPPAGEASRVA